MVKFCPGGFFDLLFNIELKKVGVKIFREISYFSSPNTIVFICPYITKYLFAPVSYRSTRYLQKDTTGSTRSWKTVSAFMPCKKASHSNKCNKSTS